MLPLNHRIETAERNAKTMKKRVLIILLALFMLAACACADSPADPESGAESKDGYLICSELGAASRAHCASAFY